MSKFHAPKTISLAFLGEGWADCHITFSAFSIRDVQALSMFAGIGKDSNPQAISEASGKIISILEDKFVDGKGYDGSKVIPIKKEELADLPNQVIPKITEALAGDISPKG